MRFSGVALQFLPGAAVADGDMSPEALVDFLHISSKYFPVSARVLDFLHMDEQMYHFVNQDVFERVFRKIIAVAESEMQGLGMAEHFSYYLHLELPHERARR